MIGGHPHIDLNTTVAYLNVSPAFVGIASAVASSLAPSKVRHIDVLRTDCPHRSKSRLFTWLDTIVFCFAEEYNRTKVTKHTIDVYKLLFIHVDSSNA